MAGIGSGEIETIYCVLIEAEGLLARAVLETLPALGQNSSIVYDYHYYHSEFNLPGEAVWNGYMGITRFTYYHVTRTWDSENEKWVYVYTEITTEPYLPWDLLLNWQQFRVFNLVDWFGFTEAELIYMDIGVRSPPDPENPINYGYTVFTWQERERIEAYLYTYTYQEAQPGRHAIKTEQYGYRTLATGYTYSYHPITSDYSEWFYNPTVGNTNYPYLLHIKVKSNGNYDNEDKNLRDTTNVAIRYIGEMVVSNITVESWIEIKNINGNFVGWETYTESRNRINNKHIWLEGHFRTENLYYNIASPITDRPINVLKDIEAKVIELGGI